MSAKRWVRGWAMVYVVLVLSGCGGGGGGGGVMDGGGAMSDVTLSEAASRAARSTPQQGSVLQSSNTDASNIVRDAVTASPSYHADHENDGQRRVNFELTYDSNGDGEPEVTVYHSDRIHSVPDDTGFPICPTCTNRAHIPGEGAGTWRGTFLQHTIGPEDQTDQIPQGHLFVLAFTDLQPHVEKTDDTDYMAGGTWWFYPENPEIPFVFGVIGDTNNPFDEEAGGSNIQALTGTATYQGDAIGSFVATDESLVHPEGRPTGFFSAVVNLEANFDAGVDGMGTISGSVHDPLLFDNNGGFLRFKDSNEFVPSPITTLELGEAAITESVGGFFTGDTRGTDRYDGQGYSGQWGGEFFGKDETSHPEGVGGSFGASKEDGTVTFIGAFGTYQQSSTPSSTP